MVRARRLGPLLPLRRRRQAEGPDHRRRVRRARGSSGSTRRPASSTSPACGREPGEDPYFTHLYRVGLDGSGLKQLDQGDASHAAGHERRRPLLRRQLLPGRPGAQVRAPRRRRATCSSSSRRPTSRRSWRPASSTPSRSRSRPTTASPTSTASCTSPSTSIRTQVSRSSPTSIPGPRPRASPRPSCRATPTSPLAQLGFVVIEVGNRGGHPSRSKWYHNYGYGNLRDYGLADKKRAIEQLATLHPYIDIDRVGIYGHSGGGFMSTAAMLVYPDFFKVAVSSSGNHENNVYNRWWSEKHHGVKEVTDKEGNVKFEYSIDKNSEIAKNLKGHLLITTGDIDNNVHPANTLRLAAALIKAGKRFDFFIFPGQRHGYGDMGDYWFWFRADYFCKWLLGDFSQTVDLIELQREKEQTGDKKPR
ncbi:MAG: prolyl oligopeptidase family serine peptidase [Candidatus Moduliflexus flocculans]|nr:prolyl oligopeptidase family serine peptidase [Candidatus Moduliflexus flocculans]